MKKVLVPLLVLVVVAGSLFALWHFSSSRSLSPEKLVPSSADLYIEISSFAKLDTAVHEFTSAAGFPTSLSAYKQVSSGKVAGAIIEPDKAGLNSQAPIGYALTFNSQPPSAVALYPIKDQALLEQHLGLQAGELEKAPTAIEATFVQAWKGYLLLAETENALTDFMATEEKDRGISIPPPPDGAVARFFIQPSAMKIAIAKAESTPAGAPMAALLKSVDHIEINLLWLAEGLRLRSNLHLTPDNLLAAAVKPSDKPVLLELLPKAGFLTGFGINSDGSQKLVETLVNSLASTIEDTAALAHIRSSMEYVGEAAATAIVRWTANPSEMQSINIMQMPKGREEAFMDSHLGLVTANAKLVESMMPKMGVTRTSVKHEPIPADAHRNIPITGIKIKTNLGLEPPPGATPEILEMFKAMNEQTVVNRFARISDPAKSGPDLFVTATGPSASGIKDQLDLLMDSGESKAISNPSVNRIAELLGTGIFGWAIIEPFYLAGFSPELENTIGISGRIDGNQLVVELILPREHLVGVPMKIMALMAGAR